jgi:predicted RNA-binding Zn ribbon-like protein
MHDQSTRLTGHPAAIVKDMSTSTWAVAGERKPAPGPLLLVQAFVNTRDADLGTDLLTEPAAANRWLTDAGLQGPEITATADELRAARAVREEVRALLASNAGAPPPAPADLPELRAIMREARLRLSVDADAQFKLAPEPAARITAGLLNLLLVIRDAQRDGTWARLKACGNEDCRWAFFDRSHSRQGAWCDMASCGNLIKNRNLRARRGVKS